MELVIFVPALMAMASLFYWGVQKTLLNVCLPCLLLLPTYFYWKMQGFPGLDFGMSVLMPLGAAMLVPALSRWKFSRTDLWIAVYIFTSAYADFRLGNASLAKYRLFDVIFAALVPYMAGRLLIEAGARVETVKRITLILFVSCILAIPECFLKFNLFLRGWMHFFHGQWPGWSTQLRWGFGRVAGPCGSPELFGIVLMTGLLLLLWLRHRSPLQKGSILQDWSGSKWITLLVLGVFSLTIFLTESRGPWLGLILGLLVASVGRAKRVGRRALFTGVFCLLIAVPAYTFMKGYASGPRKEYGSDQETAQYRREMMENYLPVAKAGGLWGWGTFHPVLNGQPSIDNEFLRIFLVQGYVGLLAYVLLIVEGGYALLRVGLWTKSQEDRHFCFTLLGLLAGWTLTLSTVYMGAQSYQLFFLIVGWTQAIPRKGSQAREQASVPTQLSLNRVYT